MDRHHRLAGGSVSFIPRQSRSRARSRPTMRVTGFSEPLDESPDGIQYTVTVSGDIDIDTALPLQHVLTSVLRLPWTRVRCDLSQVTFFGARAIAVFAHAHQLAAARNIEFVLQAVTIEQRQLLGFCHLEHLIAQTTRPAQPALDHGYVNPR